MLPRLLSPAAPPALVARVRAMILDAPLDGVLAAQRGLAERPDRAALLRSFGGPFLAVGGEFDPVTPPAEIEALAGTARRGRAVIVPGAGHLPGLEHPEVFRRGFATLRAGALPPRP